MSRFTETPRGVARHQETPSHQYFRDTRPLAQRFTHSIAKAPVAAVTILGFAVLFVAFPALVHFSWLFLGIVLPAHLIAHSQSLPLRLPATAPMKKDAGDPLPSDTGYHKPRGIVFLGNDNEAGGQEIWAAAEDVLTHSLVIGATGSGKTESLVSEGVNYVGMGGGWVYTDAKAAPKLAWQIYAIARRCGAEDDYHVINYMTGSRTIRPGMAERLTNTNNAFATGSADSLIQLMASLVPDPSEQGGNAVFGERALSLVSGVLYALVDLRDKGLIPIGINTLREALNVERVMTFADDANALPISDRSRFALKDYLQSAGWKQGEEKQPDEFYRQHGFAQMYFTRSLASLSDTYGHIYWTSMGEIDFRDVMMQNRILCIMLPALEKSPAELKNLGKINLASIKEAVSVGLGGGIEGSKQSVLESLPTASKVPSKVTSDEHGYISVDGFGVVLAQARGLGTSVTIAGQGWSGIKRGGENEAGQLWDNTRIKIFGALEDPESRQKLQEAVGEAYVTQVSGFEIPGSSLGSSYFDTHNAGVEKRNRVDPYDLQQQREGKAHVVIRGRLIRMIQFYADPPLPEQLYVNRCLTYEEDVAQSLDILITPPKARGPSLPPAQPQQSIDPDNALRRRKDAAMANELPGADAIAAELGDPLAARMAGNNAAFESPLPKQAKVLTELSSLDDAGEDAVYDDGDLDLDDAFDSGLPADLVDVTQTEQAKEMVAQVIDSYPSANTLDASNHTTKRGIEDALMRASRELFGESP